MSVRRRSLFANEDGTAAVEFAMVAPIFLVFLVGTMNLGLMLFTLGSMQYAVEDAARCASVKTTVCSDSATTTAYAKQRYFSALAVPKFAVTTPACGHQVSATVTYSFITGVKALTVPLNASACFP